MCALVLVAKAENGNAVGGTYGGDGGGNGGTGYNWSCWDGCGGGGVMDNGMEEMLINAGSGQGGGGGGGPHLILTMESFPVWRCWRKRRIPGEGTNGAGGQWNSSTLNAQAVVEA